jgi:ppGpp synthetase/RelA/SpoT-type nucleotidyltranferase
MKVLQSVGEAFLLQSEVAPLLEAELRSLFESRDPRWYFSVRSKGDESFALKAESGRVSDVAAMEDFVGCMVVVPLISDIPSAIAFVERFFEVKYRRPESDRWTEKKSSDFPFDDLRLYGNLIAPSDLPARPIDAITFEIQIKTFLQHAWSIATHDLVYKFDRVSWARNRVAHQVKALLEHAELSVSAISELEGSGLFPEVGSPESSQQRINELIASEWPEEELPEDRRRLATNVWALLNNCEFDIANLPGLLARGRTEFQGFHPRTLSPFQCVLLYVAMYEGASLRPLLDGSKPISGEYRIAVADIVLEQLNLTRGQARRVL